MENAAEIGDPRVPHGGHCRTGQRAHTQRRHLLVPRGRTGAGQRTGHAGGGKTRSEVDPVVWTASGAVEVKVVSVLLNR